MHPSINISVAIYVGSLIDNCVRSIAILYPKKLINDGVTKPSKDFVKNSRLIIKPIYVLLKPLLNTALAPIRLSMLEYY